MNHSESPIKFAHPNADLLIPDGAPTQEALARTTHLCLAAHQDDIEIFAYNGIAECFGKDDQWFGGVVITNGSASARSGLYADYTDEQMQEVRRSEQRKAAYVGEYSFQAQLAHPSSIVKDPDNPDVVADLKAIVESTRPDIVYLHNPADKHDTHIGCLLRCLQAIRALPHVIRPQKALGCEVWRDLDWLLDSDKQVLPVEKYGNIAAALVGIFDSQITGGKRYDLATTGRRLANATYYNSHSVDAAQALTFAIDLTPLIQDDTLCIKDYTLGYIERFKEDVAKRIEKMGG